MIVVGGELEDKPAVLPAPGLGGEGLQPLHRLPIVPTGPREGVLDTYQVQLQRAGHRLRRAAPHGNYSAVILVFRRHEDGHNPLLGKHLVQNGMVAVQVQGFVRIIKD